jgi:type VI secretion system secreted protein Hcp
MKLLWKYSLLLVAVATMAASTHAAIYLKIESPIIEGEVTAKGYEKQIEILSFSHQIANSGTVLGGTGGGGAGKAMPSPISVTKLLEKSSPALMLRCNRGDVIGKATFTFTVNNGTVEQFYYRIVAENVLIKKVAHSAAGERPTEELEFEFSMITWTYYPTPGSTAGAVESVWDYATNTGG